MTTKPPPLPYENATSGKAAVNDMQKILQSFGAASFGHMEDFDKGEVIVQFRWRDRSVTIRASAKGYAAAWLRRLARRAKPSVAPGPGPPP